ncbi:MAG: DUF1326 domain-containing protein [Planctomycetota bacterium]
MISLLPLALVLAADAKPQGTYVEARTAAVFAGACHFGGQYTTQGRSAVAGWHVERGAHAGVDLAGVDLAVVVTGSKNLDAKDAVKRSIVYVDASVSAQAREAAVAWLRSEYAVLVGKVEDVRAAKVEVGRKKDDFWLRAGSSVELTGNALPERECCKMSYNLWYDPLAPIEGRLVGNVKVFRTKEKALDLAWNRTGENDAFFGTFGGPAPATL